MKNVFGFIGKAFGKLWTWIKETAWVQPLLIVGVIFGVIFSITPITQWIQDLSSNQKSAETYYKKYRKSLEGEETSDADKLLQAVVDESSSYGKKFFIIFVSEGCLACENLQPAVELLRTKTSRFYDPNVGEAFKFYTINLSETTKNDDNYTKNAFNRLFERHTDFFTLAKDVGEDSWYNLETPANRFTNLAEGNIETPTLLLYDLTDSSPVKGLSEVLFGVPGNGRNAQAEVLADAWMHRGDFRQD